MGLPLCPTHSALCKYLVHSTPQLHPAVALCRCSAGQHDAAVQSTPKLHSVTALPRRPTLRCSLQAHLPCSLGCPASPWPWMSRCWYTGWMSSGLSSTCTCGTCPASSPRGRTRHYRPALKRCGEGGGAHHYHPHTQACQASSPHQAPP